MLKKIYRIDYFLTYCGDSGDGGGDVGTNENIYSTNRDPTVIFCTYCKK